MIDLKDFLDKLAGENHPFCKGPDLEEGSAFSLNKVIKPVRLPGRRASIYDEQQVLFNFMRINKN